MSLTTLAQVRTGSLIENGGWYAARLGFDSHPVAGEPSRVPGRRVVRLRSPRPNQRPAGLLLMGGNPRSTGGARALRSIGGVASQVAVDQAPPASYVSHPAHLSSAISPL